jgi:hypothetical protein
MIVSKIPFLFNSFEKRKPFLDVCFFYYKKYFSDIKIYLTTDQDIDSTGWENIDILTYSTIEKTSNLFHECHSRFYRHYYTLNYFIDIGEKYVVNCMDDGWICGTIDYDLLNDSINYLENNNANRIDICGPQPEYKCIPIDEHVSVVDADNNLQWYLTNQCSIWKTETLLEIYKELGPVSDWQVEKYGSDICRKNGYKFLTFNNPIIDNSGVFQRNVGLHDVGKKLLMEYCNNQNLNYNTELEKFNKFI